MKRDICGTYSGAQTHARAREEKCEPCRRAAAKYMREYRRKNPDFRQYSRDYAEAYGRAEAALRERHRQEFDELFSRFSAEYPTLNHDDGEGR